MADQSSQYLVQALQQMQAGAQPQAQAPTGPSLQQMQAIHKDRQAFELANPGQSYMAHGVSQMGQNIMGAPQALMQAPQNAMSGFAKLAQGFKPGG